MILKNKYAISALSLFLVQLSFADTNNLVFPSQVIKAQSFNQPTPVRPYQPTMPAYQFGQPYSPNGQNVPHAYGRQFRPSTVNQPMFNGQLPNNRKRMNNNAFPFSNNMMPFSNNGALNPFKSGGMPFSNNGNSFGMPTNPMNNMFGNNKMPFFNNNNKSSRKKAWGDKRNIWPDFYTDFTDEAWDTVSSGPRNLGTMPGGWRFPYISTPDPVTVSDAITNQFPPIAEEAGNMMDFSDWGVFDNK